MTEDFGKSFNRTAANLPDSGKSMPKQVRVQAFVLRIRIFHLRSVPCLRNYPIHLAKRQVAYSLRQENSATATSREQLVQIEQEVLNYRHYSRFPPFSVPDVNQLLFKVDVGNLKGCQFRPPYAGLGEHFYYAGVPEVPSPFDNAQNLSRL